MTTYKINLANATDQTYQFGVYQKASYNPGLDGLAWQVRGVPGNVQNPGTNEVTWDLSFQVVIANWDQDGTHCSGQYFSPAETENAYQVITDPNVPSVPKIDPNPVGATQPGYIVVQNNTVNEAIDVTMAFAMGNDKNLVCATHRKVHSGEETQFQVHPTYYVACFSNIEVGQLVSSDIAVIKEVQVEFQDDQTEATVTAYIDESKRYSMKVEYPSSKV